ncbi:MAG: hypothetical protein NVS4B6_13480 [Mycobacterium sp.]
MAEQRYQAVLAVISDGLSISQVAQGWGVVSDLHSWLARYEVEGLEGLVDRSHRSLRCPHQMSADVEARRLELRRSRPYWGPGGWCLNRPNARCPRDFGCKDPASWVNVS